MLKKIILLAIPLILLTGCAATGGMAGTYVNQKNENDIMKLYGSGKFDNIENGMVISGKYSVQPGLNGEDVVLRDIPFLDAIICTKIENGFECPGTFLGKDVYIKK